MANILVIDDEPGVRSFLQRALARSGHVVTEAEDGAEGIRMHVAHPADVIITDLLMDGMEGMEAIRSFRKISPGVPILAISGGGQAEAEHYLGVAAHLGATRTLRKPFSLTDLTDAIDALLAESRLQDIG